MYYERMPLYPGMRPPCDDGACMKVKLFDDGGCGCHRAPPMRECERVVIDNPCRPGERAEVTLGVDDCGNLVICVHRMNPCPRHTRPECPPEPCFWPSQRRPCRRDPCRCR